MASRFYTQVFHIQISAFKSWLVLDIYSLILIRHNLNFFSIQQQRFIVLVRCRKWSLNRSEWCRRKLQLRLQQWNYGYKVLTRQNDIADIISYDQCKVFDFQTIFGSPTLTSHNSRFMGVSEQPAADVSNEWSSNQPQNLTDKLFTACSNDLSHNTAAITFAENIQMLCWTSIWWEASQEQLAVIMTFEIYAAMTVTSPNWITHISNCGLDCPEWWYIYLGKKVY